MAVVAVHGDLHEGVPSGTSCSPDESNGSKQTAERLCSPSGGTITEVVPGSPAAIAGTQVGDVLLAINGRPVNDVLDYQFLSSEDWLELSLQRGDRRLIVSLPGGGAIGLRFAESTFDGIRRCRNQCQFCFVKQLPKGVRRELLIKDDDYRYSVRYGSFVTLTNLSEQDWQRLGEQSLGPLRVSVHATDLALRRRMLGNASAPDIMDQLRRLAALHLHVHTQLVLCPGINDGNQLARSIEDLAALYPTVQSIAAVPVGLTNRNRNAELRLYTAAEAKVIVSRTTAWQREFRRRLGVSLVHLADELYFLAGRRFPPARKYDGFPQFENGIGLVRVLLDEWAYLRTRRISPARHARRVTIACGQRIAPLLTDIAGALGTLIGVEMVVVPVENHFFGRSVNVSGLLTAGDVCRALEGRDLGDIVVLPRSMLDAGGEQFLDDVTPANTAAALGRPVRFAATLRELLSHCKTNAEPLA